MAAIEVSAIVLDQLQKAYTEKFGRSPSLLVAALNTNFAEELQYLKKTKNASSQRDLISDKTLRNFFAAAPPVTMQERSLNYLCKLLLGYGSYREAKERLERGDIPNVPQQTVAPPIEQEDWLPSYQNHIKELCGTIRVLDMSQPVPLAGVYADVLVYEGLRRQRQRKISELLAELDGNPGMRNLGDYSLSSIAAEERLRGLEAIQKYRRLVVLGSPGAGKTTFCKYLAMHYLFDKKGEDLIPVYIALKDYAESEEEYPSLTLKVAAEFRTSVSDSKSTTQTWLEQGKCLLLFDGLDEVARKDEDRIFRNIRDFIRHYPENRFVITCRTAADDKANFDNFTIVEVADFDDKQIKQFVANWFSTKKNIRKLSKIDVEKQTQEFLTKLEGSPAAKELATNPLMLTMLCYLFDDSYNFPKNKHSLYGDTIDALLRRWDATRRIERYESHGDYLTRPRKINLFSKIAYEGFDQIPRKRMWEKWELEKQIRSFIENIPGFNNLEVDSQEILREIELNHGLIAEQFRGIYGFSHLTFQEYFTARYILDDPDSSILIKQAIDQHLTDPSWREVFLIIVGRLPRMDQLLKEMFGQLVKLMQTDGLQRMLHWLVQTTVTCKVASSAWRAFLLAIDLDTALYIHRDTKVTRSRANRFATALRDYNKQENRLVPRSPRASLMLGLVAIHALADASDASDASEKEPNEFVIENIDVEGDIDDKLTKAIELAHELDLIDLEKKLHELKQDYPATKPPGDKWREWAERLRQAMIEYLDIGYEEPLTDEETAALDNYLYVGELLMDCIQGDGYVSKELREKIIENLLLPEDEIDKALLPT